MRFGRLTVLKIFKSKKFNALAFKCVCDCGIIKSVRKWDVLYGKTISCGCRGRETARESAYKRRTHGMTLTSEYKSWRMLRSRCLNSNDIGYKNYGGRGLRVCKRWENSFENFIADMGLKPSPKHTIERINNNRGYYPSNCIWATMTQQARNRRSTRLTETKAMEIKRLLSLGYSQSSLANFFGLSNGCISGIYQGRSWK